MRPSNARTLPARPRAFLLAGGLCLCFVACTTPREAAPRGPAPAEAEPGVRTVRGFRVQIYQTEEKTEADQHLAEALAWWDAQPRESTATLFPGELPVHIVFRQPYYRLRVGDFSSQAEAERALRRLKQRFPDAFIVPDTVTLGR